jgi:hypothetical protein
MLSGRVREEHQMQRRSARNQAAIGDIAERHGFSPDAVSSMLESVAAGHGRMAQFDHREFGGPGQWMSGGMTMLSAMSDRTLKARVERLCAELAQSIALGTDAFDEAPATEGANFGAESSAAGSWWPPELGAPNAAGSQNGVRYAYFAAQRRLAIDTNDRITVYDTLDHRIGGVSQQQSTDASLTFASQHGPVDVARLPVVSAVARPHRADDLAATIEQLAELARKGILSEAEFNAKKAELLGRL